MGPTPVSVYGTSFEEGLCGICGLADANSSKTACFGALRTRLAKHKAAVRDRSAVILRTAQSRVCPAPESIQPAAIVERIGGVEVGVQNQAGQTLVLPTTATNRSDSRELL